MERKVIEFKKRIGEHRLRMDEPMSSHTSFKTGGNAQLYLQVDMLEDLIHAVRSALELRIPIIILGGGSNLIVSKQGIKGIVVKNNCRRFELFSMHGKITKQKLGIQNALVYAESGVITNQLVRFTIENGLEGLEYQLGLPGTVGGAVAMNATFPSKRSYVGDYVQSARILTKDGTIKEVSSSYLQFRHDFSSLQQTKEVLLSVVFKLTPNDKTLLWQRGLDALNFRNSVRPENVITGCTFRNMAISDYPMQRDFPLLEELLEKAKIKGVAFGDAMVSPTQPHFILNKGKATSDDVKGLVSLIKQTMLTKYGLHLMVEPRVV